MTSTQTEKTMELFDAGLMCSEAVLAPYAEQVGISHDVALKISGGFAGGMAQGKTCGAVTAVFMVLGLTFGAGEAQTQYSRELCFQLVQEFSQRFADQWQSIECQSILCDNGIDFHNPEHMKGLRDCGLCDNVVRSASEILEALMAEYSEEVQADHG